MLKKRILPCLDIRDGRTVKGVNFVGLRDAGDPVALARSYAAQGADELVLLDITATVEGRGTLLRIVEQVAEQIDIPFTIGNDLDCDLVLRGVGSDVASCQICFDRKQASLRKWQGAPPLMNGKQLDGAMPVQERAEFTVAGQRLVLFETSIS